jgi:coproporphyrinogen III oxidase-like Fe-S oxidoreductase
LKLSNLAKKYGTETLDSIRLKAIHLKEQGLVEFNGDQISLTEKGYLLSNSIINEFI